MKIAPWARVEILPGRLLLSAETPSISVVDGILRVVGTDQGDDISISLTTIVSVDQGGDGSLATNAETVLVRIGMLGEHFDADSVRGVQVQAGAGDDVVECSGIDLPVTIRGGAGNDQLVGGKAGDEIHGGAGDDTIRALAGDDTVYGGAGNDSISLGTGNDLAFGGDGNDEINGKRGGDTLYGGNGDDTLDGGEGDDSLQGNAGKDMLFNTLGIDTLRGGAGDDNFSSWAAAKSVFYGGEGNDTAVFEPWPFGEAPPATSDIEHLIGSQIQVV